MITLRRQGTFAVALIALLGCTESAVPVLEAPAGASPAAVPEESRSSNKTVEVAYAPDDWSFMPYTTIMTRPGNITFRRPAGSTWEFVSFSIKDGTNPEGAAEFRVLQTGPTMVVHNSWRHLGTYNYEVCIRLRGGSVLCSDPEVRNTDPDDL
jgi:hypothetical protein